MKGKIKKLLRIPGKILKKGVWHPFLTILIIFLICAVLGLILFYQYGILAERKKPDISGKTQLFDEADYRAILRVWEEQEKRFKQADTKEYFNPFVKKIESLEQPVQGKTNR